MPLIEVSGDLKIVRITELKKKLEKWFGSEEEKVY